MSWEILSPYRTGNKPSVRLQVSSLGMRFIINKAMAKELSFNALTKYASFRYDADRNVLGIQFHQKKTDKTVKIMSLTMNNSLTYQLNVTTVLGKLFKRLNRDELNSGTYLVEHSREKEFLVISLNSFDKIRKGEELEVG